MMSARVTSIELPPIQPYHPITFLERGASLPFTTPIQRPHNRRFGVAIAFVLLLILFTLAVSIVLKPRGRDLPQELSQSDLPALLNG